MARYRKKSYAENSSFLLILFFVIVGVAAVPVLSKFASGGIYLAVGLVVVVTLLGLILVLFISFRERAKVRRLIIEDIDRMSGVDFERYVGEILKSQGYRVSFTAVAGDYGIDIIAKKDHQRLGIQLKRYSRYVGIEAVYQAVGGLAHYNCNQAMVVTNNYFTQAAKNLAASNKTILIDRDKLAEWILKFRGIKEEELIMDASEAYKIVKNKTSEN